MKGLKKRITWISCIGLFLATAVIAGCSTSEVKPEDVAPGPGAQPGGSGPGEGGKDPRKPE